MTDLATIRDQVIGQTYREVLPAKFDSREANVLLLAIGLQESRFAHRKQIGGPARGFWQFEKGGGVRGVLWHGGSARYAAAACAIRAVQPDPEAVYPALAQDDLLACAFARLLLWTDPKPLPAIGAVDEAWAYYLRNWRPGKPHAATWAALYRQAVEAL